MILTISLILLISLPLFFYSFIPYLKDLPNKHFNQKKILIIVIGPLIRSPRMLNHIKSFLLNGFEVEVVGQAMDNDLAELKDKFKSCYNLESIGDEDKEDENPNLHFHILNNVGKTQNGKLGLITKVLNQLKELLGILWRVRSCDYLLMQNPPSIPLLPLAIFSKILFDWKIIIDWHNFGHSILALKFGSEKSLFVKIYYIIEIYLGKFADYHLTVTHKMKNVLRDTWKLNGKQLQLDRISVLHDKPDSQFFPIDYNQRLDVIKTIKELSEEDKLIENLDNYKIGITSTSFTPDEDLGMLLNSLDSLNKKLGSINKKLLLIITGKGPLKEDFVSKFNTKVSKMDNIVVKFYYLKIEDYPKILQISDFGISLHYSSSGVDLPMKVLDMFGCGLPCLSYYYKTVVEELIDVGKTGDVFEDEFHLSEKLYTMISDDSKRIGMRTNVINQLNNGDRWMDSWLKSFKNDLNIVREL